jgi:hypothetical protein
MTFAVKPSRLNFATPPCGLRIDGSRMISLDLSASYLPQNQREFMKHADQDCGDRTQIHAEPKAVEIHALNEGQAIKENMRRFGATMRLPAIVAFEDGLADDPAAATYLIRYKVR